MAAVNSAALVHDPAFPLAITPETQGHAARESRSLTVAPAPPPTSTPSVGNWTPDPAVQITATTPVGFDVTDAHGLRTVVVYAATASGEEVVYDGSAFVAPYAGTSSTTAIANGLRFSIVRDGGWLVPPRLTVVAVNVDGVEATIAPPVVSNWAPTAGTQIAATTPIAFDVTDARGLASVHVYSLAADGTTETAYDGAAFTVNYSGASTRATIAGGFRFSVLRTGGWLSAPRITVAAMNLDGLEA